MVTCLFFAKSREITGVSEKKYTLPLNTDTNQFIDILLKDFPRLQEIIGNCLLAVNLQYVERDQSIILKENDEVAVIPPISGG